MLRVDSEGNLVRQNDDGSQERISAGFGDQVALAAEQLHDLQQQRKALAEQETELKTFLVQRIRKQGMVVQTPSGLEIKLNRRADPYETFKRAQWAEFLADADELFTREELLLLLVHSTGFHSREALPDALQGILADFHESKTKAAWIELHVKETEAA